MEYCRLNKIDDKAVLLHRNGVAGLHLEQVIRKQS